MLNIYSSTRVNRPPEVNDRATAGLRSNRFKASIIEKWPCAVLCLLFVFSAPGVAVPQAVHADEEVYLFDRVITWADGTTEHVQIDSDGYYILDGVKRKLLTMDWSYFTRNSAPFYSEENFTRYALEFAYLSSHGVKLIRGACGFYSADVDVTRANRIIQLAYNNKLLVIPQYRYKSLDIPNFGSLTTLDFVVSQTTVSASFNAWVDGMIAWDNVVGLVLENELDQPRTGQNYTPASAAEFISYLMTLARAKTSLPLYHKLMPPNPNPTYKAIENAIIPLLSIYSADMYGATASSITTQCDTQRTYNASFNKPQTFFISEFGDNSSNWNGNNMTKALIDAAFAGGATEVCLFPMEYSGSRGYFDINGSPTANCETLMANMATWQAAISQPAPTPIVATTGASNIELASAKVNSNPISTSKVRSASKPVPIAQEIPRLQAPISAPPVVATAALPIAPALSTPAKGTTSNKILPAR